MKNGASQWGRDVRKALIDRNMTVRQLAECIGYSISTVSSVINGRYSNASYRKIAGEINGVLGTKGMPERAGTPSDEWCQCVKIELVKRKMSITRLAGELNVSRDRLSLVINGKMMNKKIVDDVDGLLGIRLPAVPPGGN